MLAVDRLGARRRRHRAGVPGPPAVRRPHGVAGSLLAALAVFLRRRRGRCSLGGAALVSAFGDSPGFGSSAAYVFDSMLADLGRVGSTAGPRAAVGPAGRRPVRRRRRGRRRQPAVPGPRDTRSLDVADEAQVRALLRDFGDHDSLGYFATRRDKSVVWDTGDAGHGSGRGLLPRDRFGQPGEREPGRRSAALAGRDRAWREEARQQRLVGGRDGRRGGGRGGYTAAGLTAGDRRRGDRGHGRVLPERSGDEGGPPVGHPAPAPRLHHPGAAARDAHRRRTSPRWARRPASGAGTAATSAASRWRWAGWPTRSTGSACWSRPATATAGSAAS